MMIFLRCLDTAPCGLDGQQRPGAIADAALPERSAGLRERLFLASRGMGAAQGKKVPGPWLRNKAIEAQPSPG
jgi:hypothetical protein